MDKFFNECLKCLDPFKKQSNLLHGWNAVCFSISTISFCIGAGAVAAAAAFFTYMCAACGCHHSNSDFIMLLNIYVYILSSTRTTTKERKKKIHISTHYNCNRTRDSTECFSQYLYHRTHFIALLSIVS